MDRLCTCIRKKKKKLKSLMISCSPDQPFSFRKKKDKKDGAKGLAKAGSAVSLQVN